MTWEAYDEVSYRLISYRQDFQDLTKNLRSNLEVKKWSQKSAPKIGSKLGSKMRSKNHLASRACCRACCRARNLTRKCRNLSTGFGEILTRGSRIENLGRIQDFRNGRSGIRKSPDILSDRTHDLDQI